jgi:2-keto-4-pentenoate hydratase/2-oxohepta-3-ene-1,7-dioic acid hydratase in catechol pathway
MKLISFSAQGRQSYGVVNGEKVHDLGRRIGASCPTLRTAIAAGAIETAAKDAANAAPDFQLAQIKLLPPITDPDKIICIGLNYKAHAAEGGFKIPENPQLFARLTNTLVAHDAPMIRPRQSGDFDYEGELAIVIGRGGRHIAAKDALKHVAGYSCFNDGSIRDFQFKHSLTAGKNFPLTGGFGPWIVTTDEIPDPSKLTLTTRVNGTQVQHKGIDDMIFDVPTIIAYVSSWTQLLPGDVIATGTPEGVGFARKPPLWLKPGDTVEIDISKIGVLRNGVVMEAA